jgi:putative peptidoglycan lipid II flippase
VTEARGSGLSLRAVGRSAAILTGATALAQVLGIARELFVAAQVGISRDLDALFIALVLPSTLAGVLTSGTATALVPAYVEARESRGPEAARRLAGAVLVWVGIAGLGLSLGLEALASVAVAIIGPGLSPAGQASATGYLHLVAPLGFVAAVSGIMYGVCQAEEHFGAIAWSTLLGPATTLVALVLMWDSLGLGAYAIGSLLGPIVTAVVLLLSSARRSVMPRLALTSSRAEFRAFVHHAAPLTVSSAILQLNVIADRAIASLLAPGAVSALRYAEVLVRTPISAVGPAWGAALYPALVRAMHVDVKSGLASATAYSLRYALAVFVPMAVLTAAVAPVAVAVAFQRGAFSTADVGRTAQLAAAFAPLMVILMTSPVLTGALNAQRRGRVLLAGGVFSVVLNITLDVVLGVLLGVVGIALASSVTSIIVVVFFTWRLARAEATFDVRPLTRTLLLATLASLPSGLVAAAIAWSGIIPTGTLVGLAALAIFGTLGLLGYAAMAQRLGLEEIGTLVRLGRERIVRRVGSRPVA